MKTHDLKIECHYFEGVISGAKTFEFRLNDRNYQVNDILVLREWEPMTQYYTGRVQRARVTYVLLGGAFGGLHEDYCIMGIRRIGHW